MPFNQGPRYETPANPWKAAKKSAENLCKRVFGLKKYASKACQNCRRGKFKCDDVRPCSRCVRRGCGHSCIDVDEISNACRGIVETTYSVERPLRFSDVSVDLSNERKHLPPHRFRFIQLHRLWQSGFNEQQLRAVFEYCPEPLRSVTAEAFDAMATLQAHRMRAMMKSSSNVVELRTQETQQAHAPTELALLDKMKDAGSYRLIYDQRGQNCSSISCNSTLASFVGAHREEVLSRFANCDMPIPSTELDFWCLVLYDALKSTEPELTLYMRWTVNNLRERGQPMLMKYMRKREFDPAGGVHKMVNVLTPVTDGEYDAVHAERPEICRPFSAAMLDFRDAKECLRTHDADRRTTLQVQYHPFRQNHECKPCQGNTSSGSQQTPHVGDMARTPDGMQALQALAAEVRRSFTPFVQIANKIREGSVVGPAPSSSSPPRPLPVCPVAVVCKPEPGQVTEVPLASLGEAGGNAMVANSASGPAWTSPWCVFQVASCPFSVLTNCNGSDNGNVSAPMGAQGISMQLENPGLATEPCWARAGGGLDAVPVGCGGDGGCVGAVRGEVWDGQGGMGPPQAASGGQPSAGPGWAQCHWTPGPNLNLKPLENHWHGSQGQAQFEGPTTFTGKHGGSSFGPASNLILGPGPGASTLGGGPALGFQLPGQIQVGFHAGRAQHEWQPPATAGTELFPWELE